MTNLDVVKKLIGEINPVGETNEDVQRFRNLKEMCELMNDIIDALDEVSNFKDRQEFSMKKAGEYADKYLKNLGIE